MSTPSIAEYAHSVKTGGLRNKVSFFAWLPMGLVALVLVIVIVEHSNNIRNSWSLELVEKDQMPWPSIDVCAVAGSVIPPNVMASFFTAVYGCSSNLDSGKDVCGKFFNVVGLQLDGSRSNDSFIDDCYRIEFSNADGANPSSSPMSFYRASLGAYINITFFATPAVHSHGFSRDYAKGFAFLYDATTGAKPHTVTSELNGFYDQPAGVKWVSLLGGSKSQILLQSETFLNRPNGTNTVPIDHEWMVSTQVDWDVQDPHFVTALLFYNNNFDHIYSYVGGVGFISALAFSGGVIQFISMLTFLVLTIAFLFIKDDVHGASAGSYTSL